MYIFTYDGFYITIKICLTIYIITVGFDKCGKYRVSNQCREYTVEFITSFC